MFAFKASLPRAVFKLPVVLLCKADLPTAVLGDPVVFAVKAA